MPRHCLYAGVATLGLLMSPPAARASGGYDQAPAGAVSASPVVLAGDAGEHRKIFTVTATLREEYDDNIFTARTGRVSSWKTDVAPSVLVDIPMGASDFSARYTFGMNYYMDRQGGKLDLSHEFVAQFRHAFSDRFSLNLADQFRYSTEPNLLDSTGTLYRNGAYSTNTINAGFNGQWTPLFGSATSYSNTIVRYEDATQAIEQDSMENTGSQNFSFAVLPKINLVFGGIVDSISYDSLARGYTSYTGNGGVDWQGGTIIETDQSGSQVSPYAALTLNWKFGARSTFAFNYVHTVVPTDVVAATAQIADRLSALFRYDISPSLTVHLEGTFTHGDYDQSLLVSGSGLKGFSENDLGVSMGAAYHLNSHLDLEAGYIFSWVSSDLGFRDYMRDQIYLGIRGTY